MYPPSSGGFEAAVPDFHISNYSKGEKYSSRTGVGALPNLPYSLPVGSPSGSSNHNNDDELNSPNHLSPENSYVEFDLSHMNGPYSNRYGNGTGTSEDLNSFVSEKRVTSTSRLGSAETSPLNVRDSLPGLDDILGEDVTIEVDDINFKDKENEPVAKKDETAIEDANLDVKDENINDVDDSDDFFSARMSNWKSMKTITDLDYYNEKGELEFAAGTFDSLDNRAGSRGYTKINTEEQVNKYGALDRKTDFLFRERKNPRQKQEKSAEYEKADLDYNSDDLDYEAEDNIDSNEALQSTKSMLTDSQKFAYVGITKLIMVDMATELAKVQINSSGKVAKQLSSGQRHFANWTLYIMSKLYEHMDVSEDEKKMIENLSLHGLEVSDLSISLLEVNNYKSPDIPADSLQLEPDFDLRWVVVCDLFLLLLSDGYYDSRSRSLLVRFAKTLNIEGIEILQFERRLIDSLELESGEKTIENKDDKLVDSTFIDRQMKKNRRKRLAYIGLATLGGGIAIGLSAGLLAPVIGAGLAAGLTTVGITGTSGFLAGVGGSVIITTSGIAIGAKVGNKAGTRRTGEVHTFELKPLHNNKRTNLIVTVSGWMNGELDDVRLPFSTVDPVMGDMFSLLWEPEMLQSMGQTIGILASEALSTSIQQILGATILAALMSAIQLPMALSKLSYLLDNPWNVSLDRAWKAGKILADTLISGNLGVRPITLVGFSLGARLIYSCLIELAKRGGFGLIEDVIILGNPIAVKTDQLALARSVVSGRFINGYSKKDWILGYLFRATGGGLLTVAGLSPIENIFGIENIDCTELVEGHMSYRTAIPKILKKINWEVLSEEFAEIEEPDPEQKERTRKLISEFDEARAKMKLEMESQAKPTGWKKWFKPKQKDWWEIYEAENKKSGTTSSARTSTSSGQGVAANQRASSSAALEEYDETADLQTSPEDGREAIFDVQALLLEVNDIERLAAEDETTLKNVRDEVVESPSQVTRNEDLEDLELKNEN